MGWTSRPEHVCLAEEASKITKVGWAGSGPPRRRWWYKLPRRQRYLLSAQGFPGSGPGPGPGVVRRGNKGLSVWE